MFVKNTTKEEFNKLFTVNVDGYLIVPNRITELPDSYKNLVDNTRGVAECDSSGSLLRVKEIKKGPKIEVKEETENESVEEPKEEIKNEQEEKNEFIENLNENEEFPISTKPIEVTVGKKTKNKKKNINKK